MGKKDKYAKKEPAAPEVVPAAAPVATIAAAQPVQPIQSLEADLGALSIKTQQILSSATANKLYEGTRGQKYQMEVNFLSVMIDKIVKSAFHYDVTFDPDRPKKFLPPALKLFQEQNFKGTFFAFDGKKNVYTASALKMKGDEFTATVQLPVEAGRVKEYKITIKLAATIDMKILVDYKSPQFTSFEKPSQALQCLEIVLRSAFDRNKGVVAGRAIYRKPTERMDLTEGMELFLGLFQSAVLGRKQLYLNVDVSHKAFPTGMPILQFLALNDRNGQVPTTLSGGQESFLKDHLKGLELEYKIGEISRCMKYQGLKEPANKQTFKNDQGQQITVADYFKKEKKYILKYPGLPTIHVGSSVKAQYVPMELCSIKDLQATNKKCSPGVVAKMIRFSATSTMKRKEKIMDLLSMIEYNNPTYKQFGLDVNKKNFEKVEARILPPPLICYTNGNVNSINGAWKNDGKKFKEVPQERIKWSIINFDKYLNMSAVQSFKKTVLDAARAQNINLDDVDPSAISTPTMRDNLVSIFDEYIKRGYKFVVVIIVEDSNCYAKVKQASELRSAGILTQCIKTRTVGRMDGSIMGNILLKVNAKLNGMNHILDEVSYNQCKTQGIMFVGGDVTHPSPDQQFIPSVVGVAASYDALGAKYSCSWRLQGPRVEMIKDFKDILINHLKFYNSKNATWPKKIMYYRDGVSDGQFQEALTVELTAIREACSAINIKYKPAVTFIIVQKRHHTRFFPDKANSDGPKNQNVRAGTVVDKDIVHPHQFQFYLASHAAIQGVTKPAKYTVIHDDFKFKVDDLQAITFDLCHLFTRCNRSVSYVAPTYYSHLVAARGKNYILGDNVDLDKLDMEYEKRLIKDTVRKVTPMFFV